MNNSDNSNPIQLARQSLLVPTGLEDLHLDRALNALMQNGVDSADLYFQLTRHESWSLEDGIVKEGSYNLDQGVGARAMAGEKTGFAYSDELALPALMQASSAAGAIARSGSQGKVQVAVPRSGDASGGFSGGACPTSLARDLSSYNALTFWAASEKETSFDVVGLGNDNTGFSKFTAERARVPMTTSWKKFVVPIPEVRVL